jgi:hypothetical protein
MTVLAGTPNHRQQLRELSAQWEDRQKKTKVTADLRNLLN